MGAVVEGSAPDLLGHLAGFLGSATSPAQFQHWLIEAEASIEMFGSEAEIELAWEIENRFFEWEISGCSEETLRSVLQEDAETLGFSVTIDRIPA